MPRSRWDGWLRKKKKRLQFLSATALCHRGLFLSLSSTWVEPSQRLPSTFSGAGVVSHICRLSLLAGAHHSENRGRRAPPPGGGQVPHCLSARSCPPSSAFQLASGLGAFRYPELIKVCDRFQLECEFLPETLTIRSPKHGAQC